MNGRLYIIRHGHTALNSPSHEATRGWSDIPIDDRGRTAAQLAGRLLKPIQPHRIVSSDLQRAILTADIVSNETGAPVIACRELRPWDLGEYTGKPLTKAIPQMDWHMKHPTKPLPGGESYNQFFDRWHQAFEKILKWARQHPDKPVVVVTHSRNLYTLENLRTDGKAPIPVSGPPEPGSVTILEVTPKGFEIRGLLSEGTPSNDDKQRVDPVDHQGRIAAKDAGYMELSGAAKDKDCRKVFVEGGVSSQLGCCNYFEPFRDTVQQFRCGMCEYATKISSPSKSPL